MRTLMMLASLAAAVLMAPRAARGAAGDAVMQAMSDELARSMEALRVENLDRPYFIAYRVDEIREAGAQATLGSLVRSRHDHRRTLAVEVRVGTPALDNSNFLSTSMRGMGSMVFMPPDDGSLTLEDDYTVIRRKLWLATDAAYKQALEDLSGKRAALQNKTRTESMADFSTAAPATIEGPVPDAPPDGAPFDPVARELSGFFRSMPQVVESSVDLGTRSVYTRYVNSEGTRFTRGSRESRFVATADGYAADGLPAGDFTAAFGRAPGDLPAKEEMAKSIHALGERLNAIETAGLLDTYNGPVLFEPEAAAELWAQAFLPALLATPRPVTDNPQFDAYLEMQSPPSLADKVGARVLPASMSVIDDPGAAGKAPGVLLGGYAIDDDGVPARKTTVVDAGILKTLLATREPARGAAASTGNRRGDGACPSNVLVTSSAGLADKALRQRLLALVKERGLAFGVIVRRLDDRGLHPADEDPMARFMSMMSAGGANTAAQPVVAAFRIDPEGHETALRNLEISGLEAAAFREIAAASTSTAAVTLPFTGQAQPFPSARTYFLAGGNSSVPLVTISTPALLFEDVTLKKTGGNLATPPLVAAPEAPR